MTLFSIWKPLRFVGIFVPLMWIVSWGAEPLQASAGNSTRVRPPAVAGLFYPGSAKALKESIAAYLNEARKVDIPTKIRGLVSPHAGYIYSGVVAAAGFRLIAPSTKTVILLGSSHRIPLRKASIPEVEAYRTPLGDVPLAQLAQTLRTLPHFESVPQAHAIEHSLEVQLPFLQVVLKDVEIVPILMGEVDPKALATTLAPHIDDHTLVVASTDLSHYHPYDTAVALDGVCTTAIPAFKFSDMERCEACGKQAVLALMHLADIKGWQGMLLDYRNSGDTAGTKDTVVGYASICFVDRKEMSKEMKESLSAEDRKALLDLARSAIEARLVKGGTVKRPQSTSLALTRDGGCFVTLHKHGQLRGCIGSLEPVSSIIECVETNAKNAAFQDPRFPPLGPEELSEIDIEVSILSVPQEVRFKDGEDLKRQLEPLVHGVILSQGYHRSTFLPQVWKQLPDKDKFLEHLCLKGGMSPTAWQNPETKVEVYKAEVFGEEDLK